MKKVRKNYLPTLILILVLWGLLGGLIFWVEPELIKNVLIPGLYLPFFMLLVPASFFSLALIFNNARRGLIISLGFNLYLMLRIYEMGNVLNLLLIAGIMIAVERYLDS